MLMLLFSGSAPQLSGNELTRIAASLPQTGQFLIDIKAVF